MGELSGIPSENLGKNWPYLRGQYNATNYSSHGKILIIIFPQAEWRVEETQPPKEWPQNGAVKFSNYGTRYREGLDLVVKDININIKGGEKVNTHPKVTFQKQSFRTFVSYTAHKKFMNTSTTAESVASFILEGRYLENQTSWAVEILKYFISHGPLTDWHIVQNKTSKWPLKSLHNTTAHFFPGLHGSEL